MRFLLALTVAVVLSCSSFAETEPSPCPVIQGETGIFTGVIVNVKGKRIRGASVTISGVGNPRTVKPTRDGFFELGLPPGNYKITVKKSGFNSYSLTELKIESGGSYSHVFRLEPAFSWTHEQRIVEEPIKVP